MNKNKNHSTAKKSAKRRQVPAAVAARGVTIVLPGRAVWYAQTAIELARLAERIFDFNAKDSVGTYLEEQEKAHHSLEMLTEQFWKLAGVEVSLFNTPEKSKV